MDSDVTVDGGGGAWREIPAGTLLDNYRIERLLGRGGMGAVYLAEHVRLRKQYAIKVLPEGLAVDSRFRERFEEEGQRMAALEHPGIVPVFNAGESEGVRYFAMEYLPGGDLEARLQAAGGRLPDSEVRDILKQVLEALAYAHGKGIVHRDLKPANLLLTDDGRVKISDFGLAQVVGEGYMKSLVQQTVAASMLGGSETVMAGPSGASPNYAGTIHFMAPEVVGGGEATAQSDLYAVGVIGYYLLTGRKPMGKYKDVSVLVEGLSASWDKWLDSLMEPDVEDRTASAQEALTALPLPGDDEARSPAVVVPSGGDAVASRRPVSVATPQALASGNRSLVAPVVVVLLLVLLLGLLGACGWFGYHFRTIYSATSSKLLGAGGWFGYHLWQDQEARGPVPGQNAVARGPVPGQNAVVELSGGVALLSGGVALDMVWISPGEFVMGSPADEEDRFDDEGPQTRVRLTRGYWLGKTPVTQGQWVSLMGQSLGNLRDRAVGARLPPLAKHWQSLGNLRDRAVEYWSGLAATGGYIIDGEVVMSPEDCRAAADYFGKSDLSAFGLGVDYPVYYVSWTEAMEFCRRLTDRERAAGRLPEGYEYTLPSEAQWEYAVRAGTTTRWSFGDDEGRLGDYGWFGGNSGGQTRPVGQKRANPWGLHDVHGNVWEWTGSWYGSYPGGNVTDYEGPGTGSLRVFRGGSWNSAAVDARSAYRGWGTPDYRGGNLGFRLALSSVQ